MPTSRWGAGRPGPALRISCPYRPAFGEHIAWAESNAIVFANSVLGARTNRYGDFIDICAAVTGRVPDHGLHTDEGRRATVRFRIEGVTDRLFDDDSVPGAGARARATGRERGRRDRGPAAGTLEDRLKAIGAAAASSGSVALFHAIGVTPEAPTWDAVAGVEARDEVVALADLRAARDELSRVPGRRGDRRRQRRDATRVRSRAPAARGARRRSASARPVLREHRPRAARRVGSVAEDLADAGVTLVTDTCTYITPILHEITGPVMTDSGKWAWYAPSNLGVEVALGSLEDCVRSSAAGVMIARRRPLGGPMNGRMARRGPARPVGTRPRRAAELLGRARSVDRRDRGAGIRNAERSSPVGILVLPSGRGRPRARPCSPKRSGSATAPPGSSWANPTTSSRSAPWRPPSSTASPSRCRRIRRCLPRDPDRRSALAVPLAPHVRRSGSTTSSAPSHAASSSSCLWIAGHASAGASSSANTPWIRKRSPLGRSRGRAVPPTRSPWRIGITKYPNSRLPSGRRSRAGTGTRRAPRDRTRSWINRSNGESSAVLRGTHGRATSRAPTAPPGARQRAPRPALPSRSSRASARSHPGGRSPANVDPNRRAWRCRGLAAASPATAAPPRPAPAGSRRTGRLRVARSQTRSCPARPAIITSPLAHNTSSIIEVFLPSSFHPPVRQPTAERSSNARV